MANTGIRGPFKDSLSRTRSRTVQYKHWSIIASRTRNTDGTREISIRIKDNKQGNETLIAFNGAADRHGDDYEQLARHVSDLLDLVSADPCVIDQAFDDLPCVVDRNCDDLPGQAK